MPEIVLTNITKRWDKFYAVDNLNLVIDDNSFVTLLGPSGCGKTTILRMIAGLETPTKGRITIGGVTVFDSETRINIPPNKRRVGFLFQNYALWPNMTVYKNIAFGLSNIKESKPRIDFEARRTADLIAILRKPDDLVKIINESRDKTGGIDLGKVYVKLIDRFEISMQSAKILMSYKLHDSAEPYAMAMAHADNLSGVLDSILQKHRSAGTELNENYEIVRDGKVETSVRKLTNEEIDLCVRRVSRVVKIGMFLDRYPSELSGGQQQRVAIARTLAPEPAVLFMDEPLSNLDAKLRLEMRSELQRLHIDTGSTFIYVTHDQMEAMTLATKICLINNGELQQYAAPLDVYNKPINLFTADFVGNPAINFIEAKGQQQADGSVAITIFDDRGASFIPNESVNLRDWYTQANAEISESAKRWVDKINRDSTFCCRIDMINETDDFGGEFVAAEDDLIIGVRPEFIKLSDGGSLNGEIYSAMPAGMETTVKVRIGNFLLTGVVFGGVIYNIGQPVSVSFEGGNIVLFSRKSERIIAQGVLMVK